MSLIQAKEAERWNCSRMNSTMCDWLRIVFDITAYKSTRIMSRIQPTIIRYVTILKDLLPDSRNLVQR